jgi:hypothetical protein
MASSTLKDISHLVKFDGNNFHEWNFGCRLLETHGLLDVIDGIEKIPSEVSHMSESLRVKDFVTHVLFLDYTDYSRESCYQSESD